MREPHDDKAPVGDTMSPLTVAILIVGLVFLGLILILPAGTLQTEAVYQGF